MKRISTDPKFFGRVGYVAFCPVASVTDDNGKSTDLSSIRITVRYGRKSVPFEQRTIADFKTIKWLHGVVFEVKADSMVAKDFGIYVSLTETTP